MKQRLGIADQINLEVGSVLLFQRILNSFDIVIFVFLKKYFCINFIVFWFAELDVVQTDLLLEINVFEFMYVIDHFTVVCSATWPVDDSEARVDLVLIQTFLLLSCKCTLLKSEQLVLHNKRLSSKGQVTKQTTVKWSIEWHYCQNFKCLPEKKILSVKV